MSSEIRNGAMNPLDFASLQRVELAELERHLAHVRLAHQLREQRRPQSRRRTGRGLLAAVLHRETHRVA